MTGSADLIDPAPLLSDHVVHLREGVAPRISARGLEGNEVG
ncbi:hypothetical protein [Sphingobium sp. SCG-1]|nr:hypothetical protein [Sphingobium sp. SCG-1]